MIAQPAVPWLLLLPRVLLASRSRNWLCRPLLCRPDRPPKQVQPTCGHHDTNTKANTIANSQASRRPRATTRRRTAACGVATGAAAVLVSRLWLCTCRGHWQPRPGPDSRVAVGWRWQRQRPAASVQWFFWRFDKFNPNDDLPSRQCNAGVWLWPPPAAAARHAAVAVSRVVLWLGCAALSSWRMHFQTCLAGDYQQHVLLIAQGFRSASS